MEKTRVFILTCFSFFCLLYSGVFGQGSDVELISVKMLPKEEMERKQSELSRLLADGSLNMDDRQSLEKLRHQAMEIAQLNDECGSVLINAVPNERCKTFYRTELPAFEEEFGKITGNLYLSQIGMVNGLTERKESIRRCVVGMSAFLKSGSQVQNWIVPKTVSSGVEPVTDDTAELYYNFEISANTTRLEKIDALAQRWFGTCGAIIRHPNSNELAPYFVNEINNEVRNEDGAFTLTATKDEVRFYPRVSYTYKYTLNSAPLLEDNVTKLFRFGNNGSWLSLNPEGIRLDLTARPAKAYSGKARIPISDTAGIQVTWSVEAYSPDLQVTRQNTEPRLTKEDLYPVNTTSNVGTVSTQNDVLYAKPPNKALQKVALGFLGVSALGALVGLGSDGIIDSAQTDLSIAIQNQDADGVRSSTKEIDNADKLRSISFITAGISLGLALLFAYWGS